MKNMRHAQFYRTLTESRVKCLLCPHVCIIDLNNRGKCNVRINKSGKLYSENYGKVSALNFDPIEKKPLYHFFPGTQILSLGTFGCNFKCSFCQNYHISQTPLNKILKSSEYTADHLIKKIADSNNCFGISFTYNEPVVWYEYMVEIAEKSKKAGYVNAVVSNGYIKTEPLKELIDYTDGFNIDLKAFNNSFYQKYAGATLEPVKKTLKTIVEKKTHLEVTNLIIPGLNDGLAGFKKMISWIADELGKDIPLHINRYFSSYKMNIHATPLEKILEFRKIANEKLNFVYCGNISSSFGVSDTACPGCNTIVIKRSGYSIFCEHIDDKGCCIMCNYKILFCG